MAEELITAAESAETETGAAKAAVTVETNPVNSGNPPSAGVGLAGGGMNKAQKTRWILLNVFLLGLPYLVSVINSKVKLKITVKTTLLYTLLFLAIFISLAVIFVTGMSGFLFSRVDAAAENMSAGIFLIADEPDNSEVKLAAEMLPISYRLEASGVVSQHYTGGFTEDAASHIIGGGAQRDIRLTKLTETRGGVAYTLYIFTDVSGENSYILQAQISLFLLIPITTALVIALGMLASQSMLAPIRRMTGEIKTISADTLDTRVEVGGAKDELRELALIMNSMLEELELTYNQQRNFVSNASHEMRTPIAVLKGYSSLLRRWGKTKPDILDEAIDSIEKEADNMKNLVEKLLLLTKLGHYTLRISDFFVNELLEEVFKETCLIDSAHEVIIEHIEPVTTYGDREMVKQALRIFLDNALRYTPAGKGVRLSCFSEGETAVLIITDEGVGIDPADLPHIFEKFYRCDKSRGRQEGNLGLGLSIAKQIIDLHHGMIFVKSAKDEGTSFRIELRGAALV